jgi:hypothetical protein
MPKEENPLYYVGRTCLLLFGIVFVEGLVLAFTAPAVEPPSMRVWLNFVAAVAPLLSAAGTVASAGVMRGRSWARYLLAGVLAISAAAIVLFGVLFVAGAVTAPALAFPKGKTATLVLAPLLLLFFVGAIVHVIRRLVRAH